MSIFCQRNFSAILLLISNLTIFSCTPEDRDPYENELEVVIVKIEEQKGNQLKVYVRLTNLTTRSMERIALDYLATGNGEKWVKSSDVLREIGKKSLEPKESIEYTYVLKGLTEKATGLAVMTGFIHYSINY